MSKITIGTAPDSWGVWFPSDPAQLPADRFLREVVEAGYEWIELGPYGYLPKDAAALKDLLDQHGLKVLAGTVFEHLHRPHSWDAVWAAGHRRRSPDPGGRRGAHRGHPGPVARPQDRASRWRAAT